MRFTYGPHALDNLVDREIDRAWVEQTVESPESMEPDPKHPGRVRAFRAVPERDDRVLRVVYVPSDEGAHVVTLFLDRAMTRKRRRSREGTL